jgi:hypothetical protein
MAMTALILASSAYSANASIQAGKAQQSIANRNADLTEAQATQAQAQGDQQIMQVRRRTRQIIGKQRATYAANGIDLGAGAPVDVAADTEAASQIDESTIRTNTALAAWGFKTQATNERFGGKVSRINANNEATATLISGLTNAYSDYSANGGLKAPSAKPRSGSAPRGNSPTDYNPSYKG